MTRRVTLPAALLFLSGCQWLIGGDGSECTTDFDCPIGTFCSADRCIDAPSPTPDAQPDIAEIADLAVPDIGVDASQDAAVPDAFDMFVPRPDAAVPGEIEAPFADGACFSNSASIQLGAGMTYVPRGLCTRYGVLWTAATPTGHALNLSRVWPVDETVITTPVTDGARLSTFDGRFIAFSAPGLSGAPMPMVLDLAMRVPEAIAIRDVAVSEVRRGNRLTAYVTEGKVFLTPDAEDFATFVDCSQPGARQWGVAPAQNRVAWFERAVGGSTRVVIADPATCRNRVVFPAGDAIAPDARIESAGERWLWIATIDGQSQVVGLAPDARGRLRPLRLPFLSAPAQIAANSEWIAAVSFTRGGWQIEAQHLDDDRLRDLSSGSINNRNPMIWNGYLSWAVMNRQGWEVQYAPLR